MPTPRDTNAPITFVIPGQRQDGITTRGGASAATLAPSMGLRGSVKASVRVGATRGVGDAHRVTAVPGADMVVLHIANGPTLVLHPHTARDLMMAQSGSPRPGTRSAKGAVKRSAAPNEVAVPAQLSWPGLAFQTGQRIGVQRIDAFDHLVVDTLDDRVGGEVLRGRAQRAGDHLDQVQQHGADPPARHAAGVGRR